MTKPNDQSKTVLVAGASGYLGRHVVRSLVSEGHRIRALVRDPQRLRDVRALVDEVVVADSRSAEALRGVCNEVDAVITTIGLMSRSGSLTPSDVDLGANLSLLREAERAGVRRFIYISVLQRPGMEHLAIVAAKRAFEGELAGSQISSTVVRPNGFFSDMQAFLDMARGGRAYVFGRGAHRINPIDGADVAAVAVSLLEEGQPIVEVGGPDVLTHDEIARRAFVAVHRQPRITHVPGWVARAALSVVRRLPTSVHAVPEFVLTVLSRDLIAPAVGLTSLDHFFRAQGAGWVPLRGKIPLLPGAVAVRRLLGTVFLIAGVSKFFNAFEDVPGRLAAAAQANALSILSGPSQWLCAHAGLVAAAVGAIMVFTGGWQLLGARGFRLAGALQLLMLLCFSLILHRAYPLVVPNDVVFAAAVLWTLPWRHPTPPEHFGSD